MPVKETRVEGPTPNGAEYAIVYENTADGSVEIVEYDSDGNVLQRTYGTTRPADDDQGLPSTDTPGW